MKRLAIRAALAVAGMAIVLGWWTFSGNKGINKTGSTTKMPAKIFGGGGRTVTIDADVNGPATLGFLGSLPRKPGGDQPLEEDAEHVDAGAHSWTIELAPHTTGTFDLRAEDPKVGNRLTWTVKLDGKQIAQETDTLDKPLQAGYAQDLQASIEDEAEPAPEPQ